MTNRVRRTPEGEPQPSDAWLLIRGYRLTTVEIVYHMPDHPGLLQSFVWQRLDRPPDYPRLRRFLDFWTRNLDGALHSVKIARSNGTARLNVASHWARLH